MMRLDKLLAKCGYGSRREVKLLIRSGAVGVNRICERKDDAKIDPKQDVITVHDIAVVYESFLYIMLNKPTGYLSANEDSRHATVFDLLPEYAHRDLFCVGRLDIDSEGLLLLSDDGELAHRLLAPKHHVEKLYEVQLLTPLTQRDIVRLESGITLADETKCLPCRIVKSEDTCVQIAIMEGKFHQVKRMFLAVGNEVQHLKRLQMGPLRLDDALELGSYRPLHEEEMKAIFAYKK